MIVKSFITFCPGDCTIKHFGLVIYRKLTNSALSSIFSTVIQKLTSLDKHTKLRVPNVFVVQASGECNKTSTTVNYCHYNGYFYNIEIRIK